MRAWLVWLSLIVLTLVGCGAQMSDDAAPKSFTLRIRPDALVLRVGEARALFAERAFVDGTIETIAPTWTSSDVARATIDARGIVQAKSAGTALIVARAYDRSASLVVQIEEVVATKPVIGPLTVLSLPKPIALEVSPPTLTLAAGCPSKALAARATFDDGATRDVSTEAAWSSSDPTKVSVDAAGNVRALRIGFATVTATFAGLVATATITGVTDCGYDPLEVTPPAATAVAGGAEIAFKATAIVEGAVTSDVTTKASWASSDPTVQPSTQRASPRR